MLILLGIFHVAVRLVDESFFVQICLLGLDLAVLSMVILSFGAKSRKIILPIVGPISSALLIGLFSYHLLDSLGNQPPAFRESSPWAILVDYQPFKSDSKIVKLPEPASLRLTANLPRLDGATALYPVYSSLVNAVYPEKEYDIKDSEVMCNTTIDAFKNLVDGKVDLIFCAQPSIQQLAYAKQKSVQLELTKIGKEAFVFFVNSDNPISSLTTAQIVRIYSGQSRLWSDFGGNFAFIKAYQRPEGSGSQTILQKIMGKVKIMKPSENELVSDMESILSIVSADYRNYTSSIGYSFLFYSTVMTENQNLKLLKINGIYPSREEIQSGRYPYSSHFFAITTKKVHPNVDSFISWMQTAQGQYIVKNVGYVPLH